MPRSDKYELPESGGWVIVSHPPAPLAAPTKDDPKREESYKVLAQIPAGSVHWAVPSTITRYARRQRKLAQAYDEELSAGDLLAPGLWGGEPNWVGAMVIRWEGVDVRLFPHEAHAMQRKNLGYLLRSEAYELVPGDVATGKIIAAILDGETRPIYEAALLDGCSHEQAMAVAMEEDVFSAASVPEPMGWYRLREPYASVFN